MNGTPVNEAQLRDHQKASLARAKRSLDEAEAILDAGQPSAALVWAVRSVEIFMSEFVLAPRYMQEGQTWERSMRLAHKLLGPGNWNKAFDSAETWYGPFDGTYDTPLTTDGQHAWEVWRRDIVGRRGDLVHGALVPDASSEEASTVIQYAQMIMQWYPLRFAVSQKHVLGTVLREAVAQASASMAAGAAELSSATSGERDSPTSR